MRIISGEYKGRKLASVSSGNIRPTTDFVRESIFNILNNKIEFSEAVVLDICSGTGAMGLEALSRGASYCTFIDKSKASCDILRKNIDLLAVSKEYFKIIQADAVQVVQKEIHLKEKLPNLVFIDPPYKIQIANSILNALTSSSILQQEAIICLEYSASLGIEIFPELKILTEKNFSETSVKIFEYLK